MGGMSGEHEVSLISAKSVIESLNKKLYKVVPIKISKAGKWSNDLISADPNQKSFDVVLPILHGTYGEDGKIQGLLEMANIPYAGAGVIGSAVAMDKIIAKQLFGSVGINNVKFEYFIAKDWSADKPKIIKQIEANLSYPLFVKPANMGSSVGISKVKSKKQLAAAINQAAGFDRRIIVEESVENCREVECAVLGNNNPKASVPGEVIPEDEFYTFSDKYINGKTRFKIPANLPKKLNKSIQELSIKAFKVLDLAGLARVDFLVDPGGKIYINEVNTIPGFTSISMYPKLWDESGLSYGKLLDELIRLAIERHQEKSQLKTTFNLKPKV